MKPGANTEHLPDGELSHTKHWKEGHGSDSLAYQTVLREELRLETLSGSNEFKRVQTSSNFSNEFPNILTGGDRLDIRNLEFAVAAHCEELDHVLQHLGRVID